MNDTRRGRLVKEVVRWSTVVLIVLVIVLSRQVSSLHGSVDRLEQSSSRTERSAAELVAFVHEIQAQQQQPADRTNQAIKVIVDVLCASSDPVRIQACAALTR